MNNKARSNKNAICLHFPYLLNICRKFEFLISQGSVAKCQMVIYCYSQN